MTHSYDDPADAGPRGKTERWLIRSFGVTLAVAAVVSLMHLVDQYRQAGPYRETLAAERAAREAQRALESQPPVSTLADEAPSSASSVATGSLSGPAASAGLPNGAVRLQDLSPDQRREVERFLSDEAARAPPTSRLERPSVSQPIRWYIPPSWPSVRSDAFPTGVSRMGVQFRCRVTRDGVLADCAATEEPAGTGLAARMRPALDRARVDPPTAGGRPVESQVSFGITFSAAPRRAAAPPPSIESAIDQPPVHAPAPSAETPLPESAPAG